jgi:hypothetical protein
MKKITVSFVLIYIIVNLSAQNLNEFWDETSKKYGFKDAKGKVIVAPKYDTIQSFKDDVAVVGKKVTYSDYQYGLINKAGKEIVPLIYEIVYTDAGIIVVQSQNKYGFIDKAGKKLTPLKYNNVWGFSDGIAGVELYDREKGIGKWGFVDNTGKMVIPIKYDGVLSNKKGVIAEREGKYFAVAKSGKETPLNYEKIGYAAYGLLLVKANNKYGFINSMGEVIIPLKYDNAYDFSSYSRTGYLTSVRLGNKSGFIDTTGKEAVPIKYDWVGLFREGLATVTMNMVPAADSKNGYIDSVGNLVIPMIYNSAKSFSEGLAAVSKQLGGKSFTYGYINKEGKEAIPFMYESADEFSGGLAAVKKNGKYGFIDKEGKEVIAFKYDHVHKNFTKGGSKWDTAEVELNGKRIRVNKEGKEL